MALYLRPATIDEALSRLGAGRWTIVAGCTDYYCQRTARPMTDDVLDITGMAGARGIADAGEHLRLGALTTWSDIAAADLPPQLDALKEAARQVGGVQIQNAGTIGGNLCNASPAADGVPPLLMADALVELRSRDGVRTLPLGHFIVGNRRTGRRADELLAAILVPKRHRPPRQPLPQARRTRLSGDLDRHGGGAARGRRDGHRLPMRRLPLAPAPRSPSGCRTWSGR